MTTVKGRVPHIESSHFSGRDGQVWISDCRGAKLNRVTGEWDVAGQLKDDHYWPTRASAEQFIADHSDPAQATAPPSGDDLPTDPGFWKREEGGWEIIVRRNNHLGQLLWAGWETNAHVDIRSQGHVDILPRGKWFKAVPTDNTGPSLHELTRGLHLALQRINELEAVSGGEDGWLNGKTPWEFACGWYTPDEIEPTLMATVGKRLQDSRAFAEWLCDQYRLAMRKGIEIGQESARHIANHHIAKWQTIAKNEMEKSAVLQRERDDARLRLLSAAGDDLCRLTQEEIKELSSGAVKIPPKEEFLASCERFHQQIAAGPGVLSNCLTLAQLIAENEKLRDQLTAAQQKLAAAERRIAELRTLHDQAVDNANFHERRFKEDSAVWLETRDANRRLRDQLSLALTGIATHNAQYHAEGDGKMIVPGEG